MHTYKPSGWLRVRKKLGLGLGFELEITRGLGLREGVGLVMGRVGGLSRKRLLCQKERGLKKQRESMERWASWEGRKFGPWGGGTAGAGGAAEGEHQVLKRLWRLWRQQCIGAFSVHSDAGGDVDVRTGV